MTKVKSTSILGQLLDGFTDAVKRPFVENKITRAFDSAIDNCEEQIDDQKGAITVLRESLVTAAKSNDRAGIESAIQKIADARVAMEALAATKSAIEAERAEIGA